MPAPTESQAFQEAAEELHQHAGVPLDAPLRSSATTRPVVHVPVGPHRFALTYATTGAVAPVARAIEHLGAEPDGAVPVVVVPYMGAAGARMCDASGVNWLDLSGNAAIHAPGLRVHVRGSPNRFVRPGRPANPFAPKSARVARWLLLHPRASWRQSELAHATGLSEGAVSKVVRAYEADGLVTREAAHGVQVANPELLLDAWNERYRFERHRVRRGTVAARSGPDLTQRLAGAFDASGIDHAFTGLAAAWMWDGFASYRTAVAYVADDPKVVLADLGFVEEPRGANLWIVRPNDVGVFHGRDVLDGIAVVHAVQAYVDLFAQSERAAEAASHLQAAVLEPSWSSDAESD